MSEFLKLLDAVGESSPAPIGFSTSSRSEKPPTLACLGILRGRHAEFKALVGEGCLTGLLVAGDDEKIVEGAGDMPWGVWPASVDSDTVARYKERGCDFIVGSPEGLQLAALEEDDLAFFLALSAELDDRFLRAVENLPVDGVILTAGELKSPLTVGHLMTLGAVRTMFGKHILVEASPELRETELEQLRNLGIVGIAVDLEGLSAGSLKGLQERIASVPRERRPGPRDRGGPVQYVPPYRASTVAGQEQEEEGEF